MDRLGQVILELEKAGADSIHFDIEDGSFVPVMTLGTRIIRDLRPLTRLPFDVHLMMVNPEWILPELVAHGVNRISVHYEACPYPRRVLRQIVSLGAQAGIAFNPAGTRLVTSSDREARIYILQVDELAELARERVTRRLTQEECLKYLHGIVDACAPVVTKPTITPLPATVDGRICQVTNTGGLNDNYFNELIFKGIQDAAETHAWEASVLQSISISDFARNISIFVDADCQLIAAPGTLVEQIQSAAQANPNQRFMLTDFGIEPPLDNVWVQTYATQLIATRYPVGRATEQLIATRRVPTSVGRATEQLVPDPPSNSSRRALYPRGSATPPSSSSRHALYPRGSGTPPMNRLGISGGLLS